ncbi:hypothetical protein ASD67_17065 [Sphingopyxis sp. Root1497]|nr:hypothetical protein ASD67_17065 [Sphingopyxis sp. Root1497]
MPAYDVVGEPLLLHQQLESAVASPARRHLKVTGRVAFAIEDRADIQVMQQPAPCDAVGQFGN